jgi:alpha-L-rhamnosidase
MYEILLKETYPSWFYSINNGATTTWERWNSYSLTEGYNKANMNSLNHYAYGAVAEWFYTGMLGINSTEPGFKTFDVTPQFTQRLNNLSGSVPTINGDIEVSWSIEQQQLTMKLVVPKNTRANLVLPKVTGVKIYQDSKQLTHGSILVSGKYTITGNVSW